MKEIYLPKAITIRYHLDEEKSKTKAPTITNGDELDVIEKNGLEIMLATIMIEGRIIEAVGKILFGSELPKTESREFFERQIMGTSDFSYSFKRKTFTKLLEQQNIIEPEKIKKLKADLNKVMEWRNAFAHGKVLHEMNGGYVLEYYSGGHKELELNDAFFEKVVSIIRDCLYTCNGIIQSKT